MDFMDLDIIYTHNAYIYNIIYIIYNIYIIYIYLFIYLCIYIFMYIHSICISSLLSSFCGLMRFFMDLLNGGVSENVEDPIEIH